MVNRPKRSSHNQYKADTDNLKYSGLDKDTPALDMELPHGAKLCALGLVLPEELDEEKWIAIGKTLIPMGRSVKWALAEWWAWGDFKYGERTSIAKKLNYDVDNLYNLATVARRVPISSRNENLSFKHHMAVTKLEPAQQKKWLARAFRGSAPAGTPAKPWTVEKLRQAIDDAEQTHHAMDERKLEQENPEAYRKEQSRKSGNAIFDQFEKIKRSGSLSNSIRAITSDEPFIADLPDQTIGALIEDASSIADMFNEVVSVLTKHQEKRKVAPDFDADGPKDEEIEEIQVSVEDLNVAAKKSKRERLLTKKAKPKRLRKAA